MSGARVRIDPDDPRSLPRGRADHAALDATTEGDIARQARHDDTEAIETSKRDRKREHLLLTVLGTKEIWTRYSLDGRVTKEKAPLAPIALLNLLRPEERPNRVMALCTSEAKKATWPRLEEALRSKYPLESG